MRIRWLLLGLLVTLLIVPAGAVTVARVVQPPGGAWVRLVAFTPYAVVPYAVALVLLVVAWTSASDGWSKVAAGLATLSLAGVGGHLLWLSPSFVGGTVAPDRGEPLVVMSLNLELGQAAADDVVALATERDVEVLALQEVDEAALDRLDAAGLGDLLPERVGQPEPGPSGTMVFARQELSDVSELDTEFGGLQVSYGDVLVIAVHPQPPVGDASGWTADHRAIRRAAFARATPTIIVGDFNATTDHAVLRELDARGYVDAATTANAGWQPTWPANGQVRIAGVPLPPVFALDHVLTSGLLHPVSTDALTVDGTDHRALIAVLSP